MISGIHHKLVSQLWCMVQQQLPASSVAMWCISSEEANLFPSWMQSCTEAASRSCIFAPVDTTTSQGELSLLKGNSCMKAETPPTIVPEWYNSKQENQHDIKISTDLRDRWTEKKRDTVPEWRKHQSFLDHITKKMHICLIIHSPLMHAWVKWHSFACRQSYWTGCTQLHTNSPHAMARLDDSRNRMNSRKVKLHTEVLGSVVRSQRSGGIQNTAVWSSLPWVQEHLYFFWPSIPTTGSLLGQETTKPRPFDSSALTQLNRIHPWSGFPGSFKMQGAHRNFI